MLMPEERYIKIRELLEKNGSVTALELKSILNTSYETIRRDLEYLESSGYLKRTHGGAVKIQSFDTHQDSYIDFNSREHKNLQKKHQIALKASELISEGQAIALDSGTTAHELARIIKTKFNNLTVVTNSLHVINELVDKKGFTLILSGGIFRSDEYSFVSDSAYDFFSKLNLHTFFLTTVGVSIERGVTYQRVDEISAQVKMLEASEKTVLITDSSKIGSNSLIKMCDLDKIDLIITDGDATDDMINQFKQIGVEVICC